jgi:hypothetical protein
MDVCLLWVLCLGLMAKCNEDVQMSEDTSKPYLHHKTYVLP